MVEGTYAWYSSATNDTSAGNGYYWTTASTADTSTTTIYYPSLTWEARVRTPEEIARETEALRVRQAERDRRYAEEQAEREAAAARGRELLVSLLDDEQRVDFEATREFTVISQSGRRYRVTHRMAHGVYEVNEDGVRVTEFCIVPRGEQIPIEDHMLAEKLMLEADEERFLQIANRVGLRPAA